MRGGPGAKKTLLSVNSGISGGLFCDLFSLLSSLFSLQTRESANLVAVQSLLACFDCFCFDSRRPRGQQTLLSVNLGISGSLFCDLFSLLSSLFSLLSSNPGKCKPCCFALISDGLGANKPCCQSIWGSLAAFFVISSLFSLLSSLFPLLSSLFSLLSSLFSLLSSLFSLPSTNLAVRQFGHFRLFSFL